MGKYRSLRLEDSKFSFLIEKKTIWISLILFVLCITVVIISTGIGSKYISPLSLLKALLGRAEPMDQVIVEKLRLTRIIIAILIVAS
jgi:iron complex transport system permease protein